MGTLLLAQQNAENLSAAYILIGIMVLITLLPTALWLWMLIDCIAHEPTGYSDRWLWIFGLLFFGPFAAIVYHTTRRKKRIRLYGK
jgi:hypothetical protein